METYSGTLELVLDTEFQQYHTTNKMDLPKIKNEDLPEELKKILGDADAEFDAIVDPTDIVNLNVDAEQLENERLEVAKKLIQSREKLNEIRRQERNGNV
jgi:hypothetical protein